MRGSVLVVEDNLDIREALSDLLRQEGYQVECATDGASALGRLKGGYRPNAILLDIMMSGMDGLAFQAACVANPETAAIPIIVVTADRAAVKTAVATGAAAGFTKPFKFDALLNALRQLHQLRPA